jgi:hypothetical protein
VAAASSARLDAAPAIHILGTPTPADWQCGDWLAARV